MQKAFRIEPSGRFQAVSLEQVLDSLGEAAKHADSEQHHWVDLTGPSVSELDRWLDACAVPRFIKEIALGAFPSEALGDQASAAWVSDEVAFFFFPFYGNDERTLPERFSAICGPRLLVTFHQADFSALSAAEKLGQEGNLLPSASSSGVVAALIRFAANRNNEASTALRKRMSRMSEALARGAETPDLDAILGLGTELDILSDTVDEQLLAVRTLSAGNFRSLDFQGLLQHLQVSTTTLETLARSLDRVDRHVESLRSQYDWRLTERTNRRLAILTVLSAVFMPLTLIAGIYGMNFDHMPELHAPGGYPITLGAMFSVAAGMFAYFWKRGWFD